MILLKESPLQTVEYQLQYSKNQILIESTYFFKDKKPQIMDTLC